MHLECELCNNSCRGKKNTHTNTQKSVTQDFDEQNFGFAFWSLFEEDLEMEVSKFKHLGETDRL
jgi:hypothetical protein